MTARLREDWSPLPFTKYLPGLQAPGLSVPNGKRVSFTMTSLDAEQRGKIMAGLSDTDQ